MEGSRSKGPYKPKNVNYLETEPAERNYCASVMNESYVR